MKSFLCLLITLTAVQFAAANEEITDCLEGKSGKHGQRPERAERPNPEELAGHLILSCDLDEDGELRGEEIASAVNNLIENRPPRRGPESADPVDDAELAVRFAEILVGFDEDSSEGLSEIELAYALESIRAQRPRHQRG